jgi:hypothetical protein
MLAVGTGSSICNLAVGGVLRWGIRWIALLASERRWLAPAAAEEEGGEGDGEEEGAGGFGDEDDDAVGLEEGEIPVVVAIAAVEEKGSSSLLDQVARARDSVGDGEVVGAVEGEGGVVGDE